MIGRIGKWKAVVAKSGGIELYDLESDISEKRDIAASHPEIVSKIEKIMQQSTTYTSWTDWQYDGPLPEKTKDEHPPKEKNKKPENQKRHKPTGAKHRTLRGSRF